VHRSLEVKGYLVQANGPWLRKDGDPGSCAKCTCVKTVDERSLPPTVFRVWVAAVSAARQSARRVSG